MVKKKKLFWEEDADQSSTQDEAAPQQEVDRTAQTSEIEIPKPESEKKHKPETKSSKTTSFYKDHPKFHKFSKEKN